jgi:MerR family copper efflux transcriptional regulator
MRIGELGSRAGVTTTTLRFYEQAGVLAAAGRLPSGYRDYDEAALERLRFVKAAQSAGLTLAEIRGVIAVREASGPTCQHVTELLDARAADLDARLAELTALREEVRRLRTRAQGLDPAACDPAAVCHIILTRPDAVRR